MKLYTSPSGVSCADCGYAVMFKPWADWRAGKALGICTYPGCSNYRKLFEFPLQPIEVEFVHEGIESDGGEI